MQTICFAGVSGADRIFQIDSAWAGGARIIWNVSRILRDATAGRFGPPQRIAISVIPPLPAAQTANLDWRKVMLFQTLPEVVAIPAICVEFPTDDGGVRRAFIDGNHRLTARQRNRLPDFETYVVPAHLEGEYRVVITIDGVQVDLDALESMT